MINRTRIVRGILTGVESSHVRLERCGDEQAIAESVEAHLRAGRILLAALRQAGLDLGCWTPQELARQIAADLSENPPSPDAARSDPA